MKLSWPRSPPLLVLDGWAWNEIESSFFILVLSVLPWFFGKSKLLVDGLRDSLMRISRRFLRRKAIAPPPLGQRPLCVLPVVYRLWASVRCGPS